MCAAAIAAAGVTVAGCGGASPIGAPTTPAASSTSKAPVDAIETAYTSTTSAGTAKISIDASLVAAQGPAFNITGSGNMDFARKDGDLTTSVMGMDMEVRF